eukprot:NODE_959_length_1124_cov_316.436279_g662_i0.p1 GENE.NODE_959_length_1124_cov_316.436279_g662_i0~~NODE_959_length_1124_cov_316.436279_g662_i0.p1  ORF type:complete len:155 (+),score=55.04 NODE_959_length_1124_cov_316.436279_g662_i0:30-467(+)
MGGGAYQRTRTLQQAVGAGAQHPTDEDDAAPKRGPLLRQFLKSDPNERRDKNNLAEITGLFTQQQEETQAFGRVAQRIAHSMDPTSQIHNAAKAYLVSQEHTKSRSVIDRSVTTRIISGKFKQDQKYRVQDAKVAEWERQLDTGL